jgi:NNP family nitrate/nitrite transporter-like MFS transporter
VSTDSPAPSRRRGRDWLDSWTPEDPAVWDSRLAWRTLGVTTYALTLGFITWFLVSAVAPALTSIGFDLSTRQLYWLTAMPGLAGGAMRLLWMFLPPIVGTRRLVAWSTALFLVPLVGWGLALQRPGTPYEVLLLLAFLAGTGGGVFSGFMPSTSYFFPRARQGTALGLQAGIGNFGVSVVQFAVPALVGFALLGSLLGAPQQRTAADGTVSEVWYQNAGFFWVPFVVVGAVVAWLWLRSVPVQARGLRQQLDIFRERDTWVMTYLYIMTFGTFSGLAAVFALLIKNEFGGFEGAPNPLAYAFLGALVGSAARIVAGPVADRVGGGILTVVSGVGIAAGTAYCALVGLRPADAGDFDRFLWAMLVVFFFAGVGNASTFKQMPMIFEPRQAGGVIGWTAAVAAFGPFFFGVGLSFMPAPTFFWIGAAWAAVGAVLAWVRYARPGAPVRC